MVNGRELVVDLEDIEDIKLITDLDNLYPLAKSLIKNLNLHVIDSITHQFKHRNDKNKNDGYTALYLLSESHLTFHSFVDAKCLSINLYTCNLTTDFDEALKIIFSYFNKPFIFKQFINR
jgi:S-adenosylmethionine decarboxylase